MITSEEFENIPLFAGVEEEERGGWRDVLPTFTPSLASGSSVRVKSRASFVLAGASTDGCMRISAICDFGMR
jgi:hypothetical protein